MTIDFSAEKALQEGIRALDALNTPQSIAASDNLSSILKQAGCEYLGKMTSERVTTTGRLVDLIDVIVCG